MHKNHKRFFMYPVCQKGKMERKDVMEQDGLDLYTIGARMRRRTDGYEAAESFGKYRKLRHAKI